MTTAVLIVAAGRGVRAGSQLGPKQYVWLAGQPMLARTINAFAAHPACTTIQVVIHPDDAALYRSVLDHVRDQRRVVVPALGGATRQASVRLGLAALAPHAPARVLIHDAARPFLSSDTISRVLAALDLHPCAIAASPITDTIKHATASGLIDATVPRQNLWRAQTPQGFDFASIRAAHDRALAAGRDDFTDDAGLAEWTGLAVALVDGGSDNIKLTTAEDLLMAEQMLAGPALPDIRTGQGFDVHRFTRGDHVMLCGVRIPHTAGVEAHSDGDVGLHALTDAMLGAIADGDIGQHFKNSDSAWRGASSDLFLADARRRVATRNGRITNVDVTILAEAPKIAPYRDAMRARIAAILDIDIARVAVKATTTEGLGFTGRGEGLAAMATATVILPAPKS